MFLFYGMYVTPEQSFLCKQSYGIKPYCPIDQQIMLFSSHGFYFVEWSEIWRNPFWGTPNLVKIFTLRYSFFLILSFISKKMIINVNRSRNWNGFQNNDFGIFKEKFKTVQFIWIPLWKIIQKFTIFALVSHFGFSLSQ